MDSFFSWTLSMEGMKPARLIFHDIELYTLDKDRVFSPSLGQVGSLSNQSWSVAPSLPDFLEFDKSLGKVSQKKGKAPPVYSKKSFTMQVANDYGSVSTDFSIEVTAM